MTSTFEVKLDNSNKWKKSKLINILNELQRNKGYLPMEEINELADKLQYPLSKIWGVISFYSHYRLKPSAKFEIRVCRGTACHVKNSNMLEDILVKGMNVKVLEDINIQSVSCLGCCALAPVFEVNEEVMGKTTIKKIEILRKEINEVIL